MCSERCVETTLDKTFLGVFIRQMEIKITAHHKGHFEFSICTLAALRKNGIDDVAIKRGQEIRGKDLENIIRNWNILYTLHIIYIYFFVFAPIKNDETNIYTYLKHVQIHIHISEKTLGCSHQDYSIFSGNPYELPPPVTGNVSQPKLYCTRLKFVQICQQHRLKLLTKKWNK